MYLKSRFQFLRRIYGIRDSKTVTQRGFSLYCSNCEQTRLLFTVQVQKPSGLGADHRRRVDPNAAKLLQLQGSGGAILSLRGLRR